MHTHMIRCFQAFSVLFISVAIGCLSPSETMAAIEWEGDEKIEVLEAFVKGDFDGDVAERVSAMNAMTSTDFISAAASEISNSTFVPVYESEFSSDPGWITDDSGSFYWQASTSALFAKAESRPPTYQPNRYFVTETTLDPTRSFVLEADIMILEFNGSSVVTFGLYADDLRSSNQVGAGRPRSNGTLNVELIKLNNNDEFWESNIVDKNQLNLGGGGFTTPTHQLNIWYHVIFTYDAETATVTMLMTNKETGEVHRTRTRAGVNFSPDMRFLGVATNPQGLPGTSLSFANDTDGSASFLIDNVVLSQVSNNTAPQISNLTQYKMFESEPMGEGATFIGNTTVFKADISDTEGGGVQLEVEVKPVDEPFNGLNTHLSELSTTGSHDLEIPALITDPETVPPQGLVNDFHWRARAVRASGGTSDWQEFGASGNVDFTAHYTLGLRAATFAKQLFETVDDLQPDPDDVYELGARGWDYLNSLFVSPLEIVTGYNQRNHYSRFVGFASGIDCSGLIYWAFNKSANPFVADNNYVANITADGMFRDQQSDPVAESDLQPGDALFFNAGGNTPMNHVAMYVGESGGYDLVNAGSELTGIINGQREVFSSDDSFVGYRQIHQNGFEGKFQSGSPVDLIVTDPDGNTLSYAEVVPSEHELIREIPGEMYYSEIQQGHDGNPIDVVYLSTVKEGTYQIKVIPNQEAEPAETYSLTFDVRGEITTIVENNPISTIPAAGFVVRVTDEGSVEVIRLSVPELFAQLEDVVRVAKIRPKLLEIRVLANIALAYGFYYHDKDALAILTLNNLKNLIQRRTGSGIVPETEQNMLDIIDQLKSLLDS